MNSRGINRVRFLRTLFGGVLAGIGSAFGLKSKAVVSDDGFAAIKRGPNGIINEVDLAGDWKWIDHGEVGFRHDWTLEEKAERQRLGL